MNNGYPKVLIIRGYPISDYPKQYWISDIRYPTIQKNFGYSNLQILISEFVSDIRIFESDI